VTTQFAGDAQQSSFWLLLSRQQTLVRGLIAHTLLKCFWSFLARVTFMIFQPEFVIFLFSRYTEFLMSTHTLRFAVWFLFQIKLYFKGLIREIFQTLHFRSGLYPQRTYSKWCRMSDLLTFGLSQLPMTLRITYYLYSHGNLVAKLIISCPISSRIRCHWTDYHSWRIFMFPLSIRQSTF
jgi:hypothetical protein